MKKLFLLFAVLISAISISAENYILYTSSDGKPVTPYKTDVFGATYVSNTYENGQGKLLFDGEVTAIGYGAFWDCSSLVSVIIPNSVKTIEGNAFYKCTSLKAVEIGNSVTDIKYEAFCCCYSLVSVVIPNSVKTIGEEAFYECTSLKSVEIGNSVTEIATDAFDGCNKIESFSGKFASDDHRCLIVDGALISFARVGVTAYVLPNSVTSIKCSAFNCFENLTTIELPNSVETIDEWAFSGCISLKAFYGKFASSDHRCLIIDGELNTFAPAGITSYSIPSSVTKIGRGVFDGNNTIESIVIPNSVTYIGGEAFEFCEQLKRVVIGNSVATIGYDGFYYCESLEEVISLNTTPPSLGKSGFYNCHFTTCVLKVPASAVDAYKAAQGWSQFTNIVAMSEQSMTINDAEAHRGTSFLLPIEMENAKPMSGFQFNLTLPEGVTAIDAIVTERSEEKITPMGNMVGNVYKLSALNVGADAIETGVGAVLNIKLQVAETVAPGNYAITLSDIIMFAEDGEEIKPSAKAATLTVEDYTLGDVNNNGEINTGDAIAIMNHVIGKPQGTFIAEAADINGNGEINGNDAICIVNYIIGKTNSLQGAKESPSIGCDDVIELAGSGNLFSVALQNAASYRGFQCEIVVADGMTVSDIALNPVRNNSHTLLYNKTGENRYAVVSLSLEGNNFEGNEGELFSIATTGQGTVSIEKALFFTAGGQEIELQAREATGISSVNADGTEDVYDLTGRKIDTVKQKGIYIINGKKTVLR